MSYFQHGKLGSITAITHTRDHLFGRNTDRGFTAHQHLDAIGIIHMNGRVVDPLIGRSMSPDPHFQATKNLKSFNRYAYVINNRNYSGQFLAHELDSSEAGLRRRTIEGGHQ
jgi:RHS repeat-associated protein